jgi:hypothetical protein
VSFRVVDNRLDSDAPIEQVWALYTDVSVWPQWSHDIQSATIDGPFRPGAHGTVDFKGMPNAKYWVRSAVEPTYWASEVNFKIAKVAFIHRLTPTENGTRIEEQMRFFGALGWLMALIKRGQIRRDWPDAARKLAAMASERARTRVAA